MGITRAVTTRTLIALAACLGGPWMAAPIASADSQYGGSGVVGNRATGPSMSLLRKDDGGILVRISTGYTCGKRSYVGRTVRLKGSTPDGATFSASGKVRLIGKGNVRYELTGTLTPDAVSGTLVESLKGCP